MSNKPRTIRNSQSTDQIVHPDPTTLHIHDEVTYVTSEKLTPAEHMEIVIAQSPPWAKASAREWRDRRYRKD